MAALVASRHNKIIREFYLRLRSSGKNGKVALVACVRKLVVILNAMLKTKQPFCHLMLDRQNSRYGANVGPQERPKWE